MSTENLCFSGGTDHNSKNKILLPSHYIGQVASTHYSLFGHSLRLVFSCQCKLYSLIKEQEKKLSLNSKQLIKHENNKLGPKIA
jgi:hypothetical protein